MAKNFLNVLELLAPAKSADIGIEAINHGADAVYIGGPSFGARAAAGNSMSDIARLCEHAHKFNARVYMALNTILRNDEILEAVKLAHQAYDSGVDALIVQDMGLLECDLPPIQLHASTQCDIRTPEKAKFLEDVGFSQLVPARELSLDEVRAMAQVLTKARIEFFIHGALCVSYSGQCYASQALRGRSANRGDCAQICRLPFDIYDEDGQILKRSCHALSLKDNNQSGNLAELIDAGVRSFKIEGRYKDLSYVKNTTAFYRRLIDQWLNEHPDFCSESIGRVDLKFEPDPNRSFNRGTTDYFVHGRENSSIASFDTPKNAGSPIGKVMDISDRFFTLESTVELNNGDGLTYYRPDGQLEGFQVNRAEKIKGNLWRIFPKDPMHRHPNIRKGVEMLRNKDSHWIKKMAANTALRKIPIRIHAEVRGKDVCLEATDAFNHKTVVKTEIDSAPAENVERLQGQLIGALGKTGGTLYDAEDIQVDLDKPDFLPVSVMNALRRQLLEKLDVDRNNRFKKLEKLSPKTSAPYPLKEVDFRANVFNDKARAFYEKHGVNVLQPAFETGKIGEEVELMRCKHCIRFSLGLCPKEAKKRGEKIKPTPLKLRWGDIDLTAVFHCKPCEMSIRGKKVC